MMHRSTTPPLLFIILHFSHRVVKCIREENSSSSNAGPSSLHHVLDLEEHDPDVPLLRSLDASMGGGSSLGVDDFLSSTDLLNAMLNGFARNRSTAADFARRGAEYKERGLYLEARDMFTAAGLLKDAAHSEALHWVGEAVALEV